MSASMYRINTDRNAPWNDLPPLPVSEELYRQVEVLEVLGNAKAALARLDGRSAMIPNQGLLINSISLQEAKSSSQIENIFTTDDELYKAYSDQNPETTGPAKEVLRYREALWDGYTYLKESGRFDLEYLLRIFREIKQTREGIRPPFLNTTIKQGGSGPNAGKVVYTPPRGEGVLEGMLDNLFIFLNDDVQYPVDILIKMAIGHYQFEAIHPFRDGNGRAGRVLNIHYLTHKGLLDYPILFLSRYILDNRDDYYYSLMGVSQRGTWKRWIIFMLRAVEHTSNLTYHKINDIVDAKESILSYIRKDVRKFRTPDVLVDSIFQQPYTKVRHLVESGVYAENTAREYLNRLCELQVLERKDILGHHYYLNLELYRILED
jgi:Fic family protein